MFLARRESLGRRLNRQASVRVIGVHACCVICSATGRNGIVISNTDTDHFLNDWFIQPYLACIRRRHYS